MSHNSVYYRLGVIIILAFYHNYTYKFQVSSNIVKYILNKTSLILIDMFETLLQQSLNFGGGVVFIPLAFGLAVGLGYVIISAARHKKGT